MDERELFRNSKRKVKGEFKQLKMIETKKQRLVKYLNISKVFNYFLQKFIGRSRKTPLWR